MNKTAHIIVGDAEGRRKFIEGIKKSASAYAEFPPGHAKAVVATHFAEAAPETATALAFIIDAEGHPKADVEKAMAELKAANYAVEASVVGNTDNSWTPELNEHFDSVSTYSSAGILTACRRKARPDEATATKIGAASAKSVKAK